MKKNTSIEHEREKYLKIYTSRDSVKMDKKKRKQYGYSNHGSVTYPYLDSLKIESLVDIGCGYNEFCTYIKEKYKITAVGVDFACPGADIIASSCDLPFKDKKFDVLTSFDMMEHLPQDYIDITLKEFSRVSNRLILSICYKQVKTRIDNERLHLTVKKKEWWVEKIKKVVKFSDDKKTIVEDFAQKCLYVSC